MISKLYIFNAFLLGDDFAIAALRLSFGFMILQLNYFYCDLLYMVCQAI